MMIEKILLADSGTGHSEEMLKALMDLPSIQRSSVTILHVVPSQVSAETMAVKWEEGGKFLATTMSKLQLDPNRVRTILRQGEPKDLVCQVADEIDADLIVMGSRGLKRLQSILSNSVSQYVFQLSSRPMLLVKDDIYVKKLNRIMVAFDGSDAAQQCLQLALFLLRDIKGGQLILTHVSKDLNSKSGTTKQTEVGQDSVLAPAIAEAKKQGVQPRCITAYGRPGEELCRLAEEMQVDLLVLGSPDRRPTIARSFVDLDRLLSASLSDYVRVNANCPVLLARTGV